MLPWTAFHQSHSLLDFSNLRTASTVCLVHYKILSRHPRLRLRAVLYCKQNEEPCTNQSLREVIIISGLCHISKYSGRVKFPKSERVVHASSWFGANFKRTI